MHPEQIADVGRAERAHTRCALEEDDAQRVEVGAGIDDAVERPEVRAL